MLNDGYGDDRTLLDYEQYLADHERLLKLKAAERLRRSSASSDIWEDVLQEGRIVQWTVLEKRPGATSQYVSAAMSNRMSEVISRGTWTGLEGHRGKARDPLRRPMAERSSVNDETQFLELLVDGASWLDEVMLRYHDGEIARVLNEELTFTQKVYVFLRFWGGWSNHEIAAFQHRKHAIVERQWREIIKPKLAERLGLLADL